MVRIVLQTAAFTLLNVKYMHLIEKKNLFKIKF